MQIGVIGIGNMGLGMALRLRDTGHPVVVCDIDARRIALASGCTLAANPAELAALCELVIIGVVDAAQVEQVLFGADGVASLALGQPPLATPPCVMLCPTIGPGDVESFSARLHVSGFAVIDAPMSGGPVRARDGSMSLMVACEDAHFKRWEPVLRVLAQRLFRVGQRPGDGARTKLVNNLLAAINLAGASEAMALAQTLGLDPSTTLSVIEASSGQSWIGSDRLHRALTGDTAPQAHMALLAKDSALAIDMARGEGFDAALGKVASQRFAAALQSGLARADDSAMWAFVAGRGGP